MNCSKGAQEEGKRRAIALELPEGSNSLKLRGGGKCCWALLAAKFPTILLRRATRE